MLDSFISIASFREYRTGYVKPEFHDSEHYIKADDVFHPLLDNPVSNSINIHKNGVIITGSNMAGKSTFLRTVGLNALLSQTIFTCFASRYQTTFFQIMSSINKKDSINDGRSFYFSEAERLFNMITSSDSGLPLLLLIDELLSGTNSTERLGASIGILKYIEGKRITCLIATHDTELVNYLDDAYDYYHFTDNVSSEGLSFDYVLKHGIVKTSNAIKLLEYIGYPENIIDIANDIIKKPY